MGEMRWVDEMRGERREMRDELGELRDETMR